MVNKITKHTEGDLLRQFDISVLHKGIIKSNKPVESQRSASDCSCVVVKPLAANRPPLAEMEYLKTTIILCDTTDKANWK